MYILELDYMVWALTPWLSCLFETIRFVFLDTQKGEGEVTKGGGGAKKLAEGAQAGNNYFQDQLSMGGSKDVIFIDHYLLIFL